MPPAPSRATIRNGPTCRGSSACSGSNASIYHPRASPTPRILVLHPKCTPGSGTRSADNNSRANAAPRRIHVGHTPGRSHNAMPTPPAYDLSAGNASQLRRLARCAGRAARDRATPRQCTKTSSIQNSAGGTAQPPVRGERVGGGEILAPGQDVWLTCAAPSLISPVRRARRPPGSESPKGVRPARLRRPVEPICFDLTDAGPPQAGLLGPGASPLPRATAGPRSGRRGTTAADELHRPAARHPSAHAPRRPGRGLPVLRRWHRRVVSRRAALRPPGTRVPAVAARAVRRS